VAWVVIVHHAAVPVALLLATVAGAGRVLAAAVAGTVVPVAESLVLVEAHPARSRRATRRAADRIESSQVS
jgi:hypothetical protein